MVEIEDQLVRILIPTLFRDDVLSSSNFGKAQAELRNRSAPATLVIDFSRCEWADPLPILVLLAELALVKSKSFPTSTFLDLGAYGTADHSKRQARLRKFLLGHGFIEAFAKHIDAIILFDKDAIGRPNEYRLSDRVELEALTSVLVGQSMPLSYEDAELMPADVLTFDLLAPSQSELIGKFVDKLVRVADRHFFYQRPSTRASRDTTLQRMRHVLLELIRNAWEHAYLNCEPQQTHGAVSVFARLRRPHHNERPILIGREDSPTSGAELRHCPRIHLIRDRVDGLQVEIFVCDVGRGITADLDEWIKNSQPLDPAAKHQLRSIKQKTEYARYPLRLLERLLFTESLSRFNRANVQISKERGTLTGLQYLGHVLGYHGDITRISTGSEWISRVHKYPALALSRHYVTFDASADGLTSPALGTFFHVALLVQETPSVTDKGWADISDESWSGYRQSLIQKMARKVLPVGTWPSVDVFDLRSSTSDEELEQSIRTVFNLCQSAPIVRTRRNFEKNLIYPIIDAWIESSSSIATGLTLCDMSRFQCLVVDHVVRSFTRSYKDVDNVQHLRERKYILLMSEDFASKLYRIKIDEIDGRWILRVENVPLTPKVTRELLLRHVHVASQLRLIDSKAFWDRIEILQSQQDQQILIGPVEWSSNVILPQYLNFSLATHDAKVASILRRSLRRLVALFPDCRVEPLDDLIGAELHDASKTLPWQKNSSQEVPRLLVGSVFVSGTTVNGYRQTYEFKIQAVLHALFAPTIGRGKTNSIEVPSLAALLWQGRDNSGSGLSVAYVRIPDSPYVAKKTEILFPIGRVHSRDDIVGTTPSDMYKSFFRDRVIKVGHWTYGGRHSLIDVNAVAVLDASAD